MTSETQRPHDEERPAGLPPEAYEEVPPDSYRPYVPADASPAEFTLKAAICGALFGILFGAANAYLGLRVGLTISTSIPVAVLTVVAFYALRPFGARSTILEANISQTIGSASSSVASGVIFTLPALYLWAESAIGVQQPGLLKMTAIACAGGLLGVLFMVPLRRFLIRDEHGRLPYPEGTACAEVLVASEVGGEKARYVFQGLGVGALFAGCIRALRLWDGAWHLDLPWPNKARIGVDVGPALLGVGYILGLRIATVMVAGGLLAWLVLIPSIDALFAGRDVPLYPETAELVRDMGPKQIWNRYIRYIGAGAVAMAGLITLFRSIPTMIASFRIGMEGLRRRLDKRDTDDDSRHDRDLPLSWVLGLVVVVVLFLTFVPAAFQDLPSVVVRAVAAVLVAVFAFFFVTVSSRIVGLVGVTSNPTSGMTIGTLLGTSLIFLLLGWTDTSGMVAALSVGAVVAIAASIAGDTSQDLKTGFLLGSTPWKQQSAELIGVLTSAFFVCLTVHLLSVAFGFGTAELPAPQATLMRIVIEGVLRQNLPWLLVGTGALIAVAAELLRVPSLPFAVGLYLPLETMTPVFVGGLLRHLVERSEGGDKRRSQERREHGVLFGSGLVGGNGLLGVAVAGWVAYKSARPDRFPVAGIEGIGPEWAGPLQGWMPLFAFLAMVWLLWRATRLPDRG